jgi:hypothetical protein
MHDTDSSGDAAAMPAVRHQEVRVMKRLVIVACSLVLAALWGRPVSAQPSEPPRFEISILPGVVLYFTESDTEPDFGSYALAAAFTANVSRFVGIEGEFGVDQDLDLAGGRRSELSVRPKKAGASSAVPTCSPMPTRRRCSMRNPKSISRPTTATARRPSPRA